MEEHKTIFNYISQIFATYGITIVIFIILGCIIGDEAATYSSLYSLGSQGFSLATLIQLFAMSVIITLTQILFLSDRWIKNLSIIVRSSCFFFSVILAIVVFVIVFRWFPIGDIKAWIGFLLSFSVCSCIGVFVGRMREEAENKKMEEALEKYKKKNSEL